MNLQLTDKQLQLQRDVQEFAKEKIIPTAEEMDRKDTISESSQAKLFAGQIATKVCSDAIQVCGAYGTTVNAPFGRFLRDAKSYEIAGGSNEILRNTIGKEIKKGLRNY